MYHLPDRPGYPTQLQTMPMQMQMPMSMQAPQIPIRHESYSGGFAQHQMAPFRISVPHSHGFFPPPSVRVPTPHLAPSLANKKVSQYRGVCRERSRWRAQISWNKKRFFLGAYDTEKEAAEAYDLALIYFHAPHLPNAPNFPHNRALIDKAVSMLPKRKWKSTARQIRELLHLFHSVVSKTPNESVPSAATESNSTASISPPEEGRGNAPQPVRMFSGQPVSFSFSQGGAFRPVVARAEMKQSESPEQDFLNRSFQPVASQLHGNDMTYDDYAGTHFGSGLSHSHMSSTYAPRASSSPVQMMPSPHVASSGPLPNGFLKAGFSQPLRLHSGAPAYAEVSQGGYDQGLPAMLQSNDSQYSFPSNQGHSNPYVNVSDDLTTLNHMRGPASAFRAQLEASGFLEDYEPRKRQRVVTTGFP